jgi:6-phosphogluconolactonase (cycloisomerase 2 family)
VRKDRAFQIKSPLEPDVTIPADSILSFHIDQDTGALALAHESHAGGEIPRHFSFNHTGDRIAITQQLNGWVSIYERDVQTGQIGNLVAIKDGFGQDGPSCVKWHIPEQEWS